MKILLIILVAILLSSCARVSVKTEGEDWDIKYSVLWRQVEDVNAEVGNVKFHLGKASSEVTVDNTMVACLLAPELCK